MKQGEWTVSRSSGSSGNCVEVKDTGTTILVRDTKDRTKEPHAYTRAEWSAFVAGVKAGEFDL